VNNPSNVLRILGTAAINLPANYDVMYWGDHVLTGVELTGSGLRDVIVDMSGNLQVTDLGADLTVPAKLHIASGIFNLNDYNLTFSPGSDLEIGAPGSLKSTSASDITINSTAAHTSGLKFFTGGNTVGVLTINTNNNVVLGSNLKVTGMVVLSQGKVEVTSGTLSLITGATISGADAGRYIV